MDSPAFKGILNLDLEKKQEVVFNAVGFTPQTLEICIRIILPGGNESVES